MHALTNEMARVPTAIVIAIIAHARNADQSSLLANARVSRSEIESSLNYNLLPAYLRITCSLWSLDARFIIRNIHLCGRCINRRKETSLFGKVTVINSWAIWYSIHWAEARATAGYMKFPGRGLRSSSALSHCYDSYSRDGMCGITEPIVITIPKRHQ